MSVFVHSQGLKTVHALQGTHGGWRVKKWQYSVHAVVECPLKMIWMLVLKTPDLYCTAYQDRYWRCLIAYVLLLQQLTHSI